MKSDEKVLLMILKYRKIMLGELVGLTGYSDQFLLNILSSNSDSVMINGEEIIATDPISIALKLLSRGLRIEQISEYLSWKDFEVISSYVLSEFNFEVVHGVKITRPVRFEIDILGIDTATGFSLAVDCKHWSVSSGAKLADAATKHQERIHKFAKYFLYATSRYRVLEKTRNIIPLIVTLLTPSLRLHKGVLIVSIKELPQFIREKYDIMDFFGVTPIPINTN
ncbi:MAG: hypothetical protein QXK88_00680 [Desulfurococcaceae archaeon]